MRPIPIGLAGGISSAVAAKAMRQILANHLREKRALKRGGGAHKLTLGSDLAGKDGSVVDALALEEALADLERSYPDQARIVELRYFAGLGLEETAAVLGVSTRTVEREWREDCNANGTPDECDLATALSGDCNTNAVPDECEIAAGSPDCNRVPDECELAGNDCNTNGTPDECDLAALADDAYALDPNLGIPDANPSGVRSTITVSESGTIADLDLGLYIDHNYQGDLVVTLSHGGVTTTVINRPGRCSEPLYGYMADHFGSASALLVLDDSAATGIDCYAGPSSSGIYQYAGPARPARRWPRSTGWTKPVNGP